MRNKQHRIRVGWAVTALAVLMSTSVLGAEVPPDLTKGETKGVNRKGTYNLGPTGLRGWIYTKPANYLDSLQGRTTASSRQILVTHVGDKSPADGVMKVDDVILGAGGKLFSDDARKSIAAAIQEAEKAANGGILKLTRWRSGKTEEAQLKLKVMGAYSDTAPYNCPKSKRIFEEACKVLEKEPLEQNLWGAINGLALLSTGNPDYLPRVRDFARKMGPTTLKLKLKDGMVIWDWGNRNIFLCEYYLLTGDKEVLHAINEYTVTLAKGQSMYGTFGHGISLRTAEGKLHGSIPPYGPVNMAGLPANLSIVMGKKCGVKDPEVDPAIERASGFFGYFVDKGSIPYGEHEPWPYHENNGKNSISALLFLLQDNRIKETQFFAKMATAGYRSRECGHTGQGFSYLWGALGANAGGPAAAAAFFKEASWHLDLVRRCDGSFTYDGGEQYGPGRTDDDTYYGRSSYDGLSPTATYVLTYSLPLKKLCITGKDANQSNWLTKQEVADAIASGRFDLDRKQKSPRELVAAFGDWSPIVRGWAAEELAQRPEAKAMAPQLIALAEGKDVHVAQGACEALGLIKSERALPALVRLLSHEDRWLRYKAAQAIRRMGGTATPALPDILKALVQTAEPLQPINWADSIQFTHGQLAAALFAGPLTEALRGADPKLLYPAIRVVSTNPDGMARATLRDFFENKLSLEDVQALAPDLLAAVKTLCPADTMFGAEIRMGAFRALTKYHYKEGIEAGVIFAKTQGGHGSESRTGVIMKEIVGYGSAAREALPGLKELIVALNAQCENGEFPAGELNDRRTGAVESAIKAIEAAKDQPELRSIAPGQPKGNSKK
jgi:HEAT repeat protein